jgi:hypothetical protein
LALSGLTLAGFTLPWLALTGFTLTGLTLAIFALAGFAAFAALGALLGGGESHCLFAGDLSGRHVGRIGYEPRSQLRILRRMLRHATAGIRLFRGFALPLGPGGFASFAASGFASFAAGRFTCFTAGLARWLALG